MGDGWSEKTDWALLDRINPRRIKSLKKWMEKTRYDGHRKAVLEGAEDQRKSAQVQAQARAEGDK